MKRVLSQAFGRLLIAVIAWGLALSACRAADWPTNRGNPARTGVADASPGPQSGKVLWIHKSTDHYVAAPVPAGDVVLISALAAFNTSSFHAMSTDPAVEKRVKWSKSVPYLKLPMVCAPAVAGNLVVFGDGMHQTDGATLHGVRLDNGMPLWQFAVPGQLVHLEGAPSIVNGRVIIGGGNAGVLCVDSTRLELEGKDVDAAAAQATLDARWKDLLAKYEQEKKTDPDFAIPPSEDALPKPRPKLSWQVGQGKWHVDAAVAVAGDRVLAASAFLDTEKQGDRSLVCLKLADGSQVWKVPLKFNPWAGPTVSGDVAVVGCSSVRLEPRDVPHAVGEVIAVSLADGSIKWRKELPGGVVSAVAVKDNFAVFTATDGCVLRQSCRCGRFCLRRRSEGAGAMPGFERRETGVGTEPRHRSEGHGPGNGLRGTGGRSRAIVCCNLQPGIINQIRDCGRLYWR
jgi:outer membrane protein assembly factor BamB